jgi:CDP-glycerol glycerophosphotransferase (TagB/SpsB family)
MKNIFIVLGRISHHSDILRNKLFQELLKKYQITIISEYLDEQRVNIENLPVNKNLLYVKYKPVYGGLLLFFNQYLRHAFVRKYDNWVVTRSWFYRKTHPFRIRLLTVLGGLIPKNLFSANFFTRLEMFLINPSSNFRSLIEKYKPLAIVTATPGHTPLEAEIIICAKIFKIPSIAININYDNPYVWAKFQRKTDYLFVWNKIMEKQMIEYGGYSKDSIFIAGCLRFDHYFNDIKENKLKTKKSFLISKNLNPNKKTILFATPSPISYPERQEFVKQLIELKTAGKLLDDPNILIRLHPHDVWQIYEKFIGLKNIHIERAGHQRIADNATKGQKVEMEEEDLINLTETMLYSDIVINFVSTLSIEASIFNKPIINIGFPPARAINNKYEFNEALVKIGNLKIANNIGELNILINKMLGKNFNEENHKEIVKNYVFFTDGLTWKRTSDFIENIINKNSSLPH